MENQHSTSLIKDDDVGMKCRCTRGWRNSQRRIRVVLWMLTLSIIRFRPNLAGVEPSTIARKCVKSTLRWRRYISPISAVARHKPMSPMETSGMR